MKLPTQSFEALLWSDELEERVEFAWSAGVEGSVSNDGWEVKGTIEYSW